jgi:hypothetical protein
LKPEKRWAQGTCPLENGSFRTNAPGTELKNLKGIAGGFEVRDQNVAHSATNTYILQSTTATHSLSVLSVFLRGTKRVGRRLPSRLRHLFLPARRIVTPLLKTGTHQFTVSRLMGSLNVVSEFRDVLQQASFCATASSSTYTLSNTFSFVPVIHCFEKLQAHTLRK